MDLVTLNPLCSRYPHQSTLGKQFPVPSLDTIDGLRYGTHCVKIKVRLIRVWDSVSLRTHYEMMTNFILIDEKEKLCWAVTDVAHRARILSLAEKIKREASKFDKAVATKRIDNFQFLFDIVQSKDLKGDGLATASNRTLSKVRCSCSHRVLLYASTACNTSWLFL
ncbi:hypothetical protein POM88_040987 [Heracleum sosnowskyi]|uniref:Uncharacterized protein n=1 Tax=Heracleum sosnowskyi TaxID=360622 RepID=A0AAD8HF72_9APIA|nr:hypothetical protein POM88_040987 [Heracleum sosnowskyi]